MVLGRWQLNGRDTSGRHLLLPLPLLLCNAQAGRRQKATDAASAPGLAPRPDDTRGARKLGRAGAGALPAAPPHDGTCRSPRGPTLNALGLAQEGPLHHTATT